MNLSKSEKLLAAKKKLREFQLSKMQHSKDATVKRKHSTDLSQCQNAENNKSKLEVSNASAVEHIENNTHAVQQDFQTNEVASANSIAASENANRYEESQKFTDDASKTIPERQEINLNPNVDLNNYPKPEKNMDLNAYPVAEKSVDLNSYSTVEKNVDLNSYQTVEKNVDLNSCQTVEKSLDLNSYPKAEKTVDLNSYPKVQKEHLLEMASAVADVLTNESDNAETSLDCDLMYRNQFLSSYVEEQKKIVNELHIELSSARSRVSELEAKLEGKEMEFETHLAREINPLKEQLRAHAQTTGILIAEKAELTAALSQAQQSIRQNTEEAEETAKKLKNSQIHIAELEKEISAVKNSNEELRKNFHQLQSNYDSLDKKFFETNKEKEDLNLEVSELKQKLNLKKTELIAIQQELQEKTALLSLSELRIQQMKGATPTEEEKHAAILLEQELAQAKESLKALSAEKDEAGKQYQNYVKQLDAQQAKLLEEIKTQKGSIEELQRREQSYIQRMSELELQLQQEKARVENLSPLQERKDQMDTLLKNIDELTLQHERLHITLSEKDSQIEALTKEVNDLREANNQEAEVTKLASALESEQLGASRAVHQNRQLKEQLTDMENAFVSLSNAKLDLTEQLQAERSIGRKLNARLNNVETEFDKLKERLREKEATLEEYEKERLQSAQIADQMQHYQAQSHHANTFQRELQHALITIERLEKEKQALTEKLKEKREEKVLESATRSANANRGVSNSEEDALLESSYEGNVKTAEAVKQLEQRFKDTMERVAELTEEKQKLEHLVLQLQSETETIGEYITLYQKQRAVLQNRAIEREQVFRQLLEQRNQQQEQLHKLKIMVSEFLTNEYIHPDGAKRLSETETHPNDFGAQRQKERKETGEPEVENKSVSEILDVLTEIKDCKDSCMFEANFHPCPWCSGKLLTV